MAREALARPSSKTFTRPEAIRALGRLDNFAYSAEVRAYLDSRVESERLAAVEVLAGDRSSIAAREAVLADRNASLVLRMSALDSLVTNNPMLPDTVRTVASDKSENPVLRRRALAEINAYVLQNIDQISESELAKLHDEVVALAQLGLPSDVVDNVESTINAAIANRRN